VARFVLVLDTPGIKQFVFGTDPLAEVRGASALLDRLNRDETTTKLRQFLPGVDVREVYAAGGVGNYILTTPDDQSADRLRSGIDQLARYFRQESVGELRVVYGLGVLEDDDHYRQAVESAFAEIHRKRDRASSRRALELTPFLMECKSASHLPAAGGISGHGEDLLLSRACTIKREESQKAHRYGAWADYMEHLQQRHRDWPDDLSTWLRKLRPRETSDIGAEAERRGYVGLVYADGNAMGKLVQNLDRPETATFFSKLVDCNIRRACHEALDEVLARNIKHVLDAQSRGKAPSALPADILLLGGDDLMVLLPAEQALLFAARVSRLFEDYTREAVTAEQNPKVLGFFEERLNGHGLTLSSGVAIATDTYPFYLLLELAEALQKSAKKGSSDDRNAGGHRAPAYVDFHLVAGSTGNELTALRRDDYQVDSPHRRTLRPYSCNRLDTLRRAVETLRQGRLPRSKLHDLFEAALEPLPSVAQRRARELFSRLDRGQRRALWDALGLLGTLSAFPWYGNGAAHSTALADLVEALDLFPRTDKETGR
jgi:hypothetical protein